MTKSTKMRTRLLAVVAQALGRRADLGVVANIATLVAGTTGKRRHIYGFSEGLHSGQRAFNGRLGIWLSVNRAKDAAPIARFDMQEYAW